MLTFVSLSSEDQNQLVIALDVESLVQVSGLRLFKLSVRLGPGVQSIFAVFFRVV